MVTGATLHTSMGDIVITFFDHAPDAVANFTELATDGIYDGNRFHYVVAGFIIQAGDIDDTKGQLDKPEDYFDDEYDPAYMFNRPYLVATAGRGELSHPTQFFITVAEHAAHLDWQHTIFGEVTDEASRRVVDAINAVRTNEMDPVEPVTINTVTQ